eukprot:9622861-Alexandrium_andersonii.AAC.1
MDKAGWISARVILSTRFMRGNGNEPRLDLVTLRRLVELDNQMKIRFLLCEHDGELYIRAAQAQSAE